MIRSILCTPLHMEKMLLKIHLSDADAFILDLEDGVPLNSKEQARNSLVMNWEYISSLEKKIFVRINKLHSLEGMKDMILLNNLKPEFIILPKIETEVELKLIRLISPKESKLCPIIETPLGVKNADEIVSEMSKGEFLFFGEADLTNELRISLYSKFIKDIKKQLVLIAAEKSIDLVDSPCFRIHDDKFLLKEVIDSVESGFSSKIAIHPSHISTINKIFSSRYLISNEERLVLESYYENKDLVNYEGDMIGPPMIKKILSKLELGNQHERH